MLYIIFRKSYFTFPRKTILLSYYTVGENNIGALSNFSYLYYCDNNIGHFFTAPKQVSV